MHVNEEDCYVAGDYGRDNSQLASNKMLHLPEFCESDDKRIRFPVGENQNVTVTKLSNSAVKSVKKFIFFVGYPRSGHSIVGSLLDSHPNMVVSNQFALFRRLTEDPVYKHPTRSFLYNAIYRNSVCSHYFGLRAQEATKKGYTLHVDNSWQGRYDGTIQVIGDKTGGNTGMTYFNNGHQSFLKQYKRLLSIVKVPILVFHVVRNPFDNIATMVIRSPKSGVSILDLTPDHPYKNKESLDNAIAAYFSRVHTVDKMMTELDLTVIEVHIQDLIEKPKKAFSEICDRLEVFCSNNFLKTVAEKMFPDVTKTHLLIEWTPEQIKRVRKEMQRYTFLHQYTLDN